MAHMICVRIGIDTGKRAEELSSEEIQKLQDGISDPASLGIPRFFLNHPFDSIYGVDYHHVGTKFDGDLRMHIDRGKKIRHVRICRLAVVCYIYI